MKFIFILKIYIISRPVQDSIKVDSDVCQCPVRIHPQDDGPGYESLLNQSSRLFYESLYRIDVLAELVFSGTEYGTLSTRSRKWRTFA